MSNIETIVKKVFKNEYEFLEQSRQQLSQQSLTGEALEQEYLKLLDAYELLLKDAVKITKIGDINQKKLFDSNQEIDRQRRIMYMASITDYLTGIFNRGYLMDTLAQEFTRFKRYKTPISCILFDIDDFKQVNDHYGHQAGDHILRDVSGTVKSLVREVDILGRYGGEEFLIILPNTTASAAATAAEKIRLNIDQAVFKHSNTDPIHVTISLGVSDTLIDMPTSQDELLYKVDCALYKAKSNGKNQYCIFEQD